MTMLDERPAATEPPPERPRGAASQPASWRFASRLARRETRRRPGRTVLAALLIAVPVFAMTVGSVLVRTDRDDWTSTFDRDHAGADIVVTPAFGFPTDEPSAAVEVDGVPPGTIVDDYVWINTGIFPSGEFAAEGARWGVFTDIQLRGDGAGQPIEVLDGRAPVVGEIMLDRESADRLGVDLGDVVRLERPSGSWTLSGIGRIRQWYDDSLFVVPGFDRSRLAPDRIQVSSTYVLPDGLARSEIESIAERIGGTTRWDDPFPRDDTVGTAIAWGWVGGVLALVAVGIIVAAAFATSARRQLVTIGQLASNGASEAVIRRTLAFQGTWTGLIGAGVGIAAGLVALPFARSTFELMTRRDLPSYRIGIADLVVIAVTAIAAGTIAAAVPAKSAARTPIMAALAGRRPLGRLPRWMVPTGTALVVCGLGLAALSALAAQSTSSDQLFALLIVVGVVAVVFGMICVTPLVIERVGALGTRAPLSWRLALRSLARSRTRSSAVVAAIAVAVGGAVAVSAIIETTMREDRAGWLPTLPADAVVVERWDDRGYGGGDEPFDVGPLDDADLDADLRTELGAIAPGATFEPLRSATVDPPPYDPTTSRDLWPDPTGPRIADAALIDVLGLDQADIRTLQQTGTLLPISPEGWPAYFGDVEQPIDGTDPVERVFVDESRSIAVEASPAQRPYGYDYAGWGGALMTEAKAVELGFDIVVRGAIVRYSEPLTAAQRASVRAVAAGADGAPSDAFIEPADPPRTNVGARTAESDAGWNVTHDEPEWRQGRDRDVWVARAVVVGVALLLTLLVVGIGLSLAAAEGRLERDTLAVVGASPASMRRQAAVRGTTLSLAGITLGIPTGFAPAWVLYRLTNASDFRTLTLGFPWLVVATLLVGVPTVIAAVTWTGAAFGQRLRPPRPARHD